MLNIIIISLQSVNEWPVFNLKKNILVEKFLYNELLSYNDILQVVCMIIIIIKFPCEIIILQIYDRNKYYIIEVPDINGTQ
jgi:hypothetical protein